VKSDEEDTVMAAPFRIVGRKTPRKDALARVTGREVYSVDVILPRMLYGRSSPVRTPTLASRA
jgi:CO/xanthine dehydrogenase Mo-binding subunit